MSLFFTLLAKVGELVGRERGPRCGSLLWPRNWVLALHLRRKEGEGEGLRVQQRLCRLVRKASQAAQLEHRGYRGPCAGGGGGGNGRPPGRRPAKVGTSCVWLAFRGVACKGPGWACLVSQDRDGTVSLGRPPQAFWPVHAIWRLPGCGGETLSTRVESSPKPQSSGSGHPLPEVGAQS